MQYTALVLSKTLKIFLTPLEIGSHYCTEPLICPLMPSTDRNGRLSKVLDYLHLFIMYIVFYLAW